MAETKDLFGNKIYKYTKRMSKSKLNAFISCPKKFQLMIDYPQESQTSEALMNGIKVHNMFDKLYEKRNKYNSKDELMEALNKIQPEGYERYKEHFCNWQQEMGFPYVENTEEKIYDEREDMVIKYDRIDFDGRTRILWDYKTGKLKTAEEFELELIQYAYYFMKHKRCRVHYVGIYFADHGKADLIKVTDERIQRCIANIRNSVAEIRDCENSGVFPAKPSWTCKFCQWNHLCPVYNQKNKK